jgi:hypothetical protein
MISERPMVSRNRFPAPNIRGTLVVGRAWRASLLSEVGAKQARFAKLRRIDTYQERCDTHQMMG